MRQYTISLLFLFTYLTYCYSQRIEISLNGTWEIAKTGTKSEIPTNFPSKIVVPGLVDMAKPAIDSIPTYLDKNVFLAVAQNSKIDSSETKYMTKI